MNHENRLFIGKYPEGIVYADRHREVAGDYKRLAFLSYRTLELKLEPIRNKELRAMVMEHARTLQTRKGEQFQVSSSGQSITLGWGL